MYSLKDISVIIPSYNRPQDLRETLQSISKFPVREIIVIDQSKNNKTKDLVEDLKNKKLKYFFSKTPSITIARNLGVSSASKTSKLIAFIDDDVSLDKNYFEEILKIFNRKKSALAVAGFCNETKKFNPLDNFLRKLFFISHKEKGRARIISSYGNTYPPKLDNVINAQWLMGYNMVYKTSVFKEQKFDENLLGYTLAEDIDFSYRLYKKHPGSIFVTPHAKLVHRASTKERYPTEKMSYINQIDHFYFHFKNLNQDIKQKIIFPYSLFGILILRILQLIKTRKTEDYLKLKFFLKSLFYCLRNLDKIKAGKLRDFKIN